MYPSYMILTYLDLCVPWGNGVPNFEEDCHPGPLTNSLIQ